MFQLTDDMDVDSKQRQMSLLDVIKMNKQEWPHITIGCIGSLVAGGAMPVFAVLFGEIIEVIMKGVDVEEKTNVYSIYFVAAGVVVGLANFALVSIQL